MKNKDDIVATIRATRELSLPKWGHVESHHKNNNPHDIVTDLDGEIEEFLRVKFTAIDPETVFVGEEGGGDRSADSFWLVDPIDGTSHYVRGLPFCTTMVARIENGSVVFGAIYDFVNDVLYHAELGKGAYADATPIFVSERRLDEAKIGYESRLENENNVRKYLQVRKHVRTIQLMCSGYEHVLVATGKIEGRAGYKQYGHDYDYAPGALLIQEAGGIVTNIGTTTYDFRDTDYIATNKAVYEALTSGPDAPFPILEH